MLAAHKVAEESKRKSLVHKEKFEDFADFSKNSYTLTISRCQQLALAKAGGRVPTPAEQLELINKRREKKKSRVASAKPCWLIGCYFVVCETWGPYILKTKFYNSWGLNFSLGLIWGS